MELENQLSLLKNIQRVDAPPFLYTRIEAALNSNVYQAPKQWKLAFVICSVFILFLNISIIRNSSNVELQDNTSQVISTLQLETSNSFYHD